ncbi:hypothetical protein FB451DRAFT_1486226 [Mycena latifolia]|nr:hypothetical protein FB451DRAFT_1486226 [Mycena latifolia]
MLSIPYSLFSATFLFLFRRLRLICGWESHGTLDVEAGVKENDSGDGKQDADEAPPVLFSIPLIRIVSPEGKESVDGAPHPPKIVLDRKPLGDITNCIPPRVHGKTPTRTRARSSAFRKPNPREVRELEEFKAKQRKATLKVPRYIPGNPPFSKPANEPAPPPLVAPTTEPLGAPAAAPASPEWHELKAKLLSEARTHTKVVQDKAAHRRSLPAPSSEKVVFPLESRRASLPADIATKRHGVSDRLRRAAFWAPADKSGVPADLEAQLDTITTVNIVEEFHWSDIVSLDDYLA